MLTLGDRTISILGETDRRGSPRVAQTRPIKVLEHGTARFIAGRTCDVSATGLRVLLPASGRLRVGTLLSIHLGQSNNAPLANRRQMIPARVVWLSAVPSGDPSGVPMVSAGVEFMHGIHARADAA